MNQTYQYRGVNYNIYYDEDPLNPRSDWDNMGKMYFFGKYMADMHNMSPDDFKDFFKDHVKDTVFVPIRGYDHGGLTISSSNGYPYNDRWDSGLIGFSFASLTDYNDWLNTDWKYLTKKRREIIKELLEYEIKTFDEYLTGQVYGYSSPNDSCGGWYGVEGLKQAHIEAKRDIDNYIKEQRNKRYSYLKKLILSKVPFIYRNIRYETI